MVAGIDKVIVKGQRDRIPRVVNKSILFKGNMILSKDRNHYIGFLNCLQNRMMPEQHTIK